MVFYFSGTGNSYKVAKKVAEDSNENLVSIPEAWSKKQFTYTLQEGERIGFVYPIHAWAPPTLVKRFIKKLNLVNSQGAYAYSILTCGDDWEGAVEHLRRALQHVDLSLQGDYAVVMPNNYVMGHELDKPEVEQKKLTEADQKISVIAEEVVRRKVNYKPVKYSFLKSHVIYALFQMSKLKACFHVNKTCVGCGLCEKACPMQVIKMKEKGRHKVPSWGNGCVQCSACINVCPRKAIDYLGMTQKRRRYFHPEYKKVIAKKASR